MFTKTIYIPFTIESKQEITDRQAQIIANRARRRFIDGDLDHNELEDDKFFKSNMKRRKKDFAKAAKSK